MTIVEQPQTAQESQPSRARRMALPLFGLGVVVAGIAYVGRVNPNEEGHYPTCPLKLVTGIDCPGCGGLRATHSLANGDILAAMDHNLLVVLCLPLVVVWFAFVLRRAWTGRSVAMTPGWARAQAWLLYGLLAATVIFTIARNLSFVPFLNSGIG